MKLVKDFADMYGLGVIGSISIATLGLILSIIFHIRHTIWLLPIGIVLFFIFSFIAINYRDKHYFGSNDITQKPSKSET